MSPNIPKNKNIRVRKNVLSVPIKLWSQEWFSLNRFTVYHFFYKILFGSLPLKC